MYEERTSDLPKLGNRPYIQGGTIFNGMADLCDEVFGADWLDKGTVASFKLEREAVANGRLIVADEAIGGLDANATFIMRSPLRTIHGYFIDQGKPFRVESYDEDSYYNAITVADNLGGEFVLPAGRVRGDFIRGIVGANKLLHQKTTLCGGGLTRIQFLYLKNLDLICLQRAAEEYRVSIANATVADRGAEVWSINDVSVKGSSFTTQFRICYRAQRAK